MLLIFIKIPLNRVFSYNTNLFFSSFGQSLDGVNFVGGKACIEEPAPVGLLVVAVEAAELVFGIASPSAHQGTVVAFLVIPHVHFVVALVAILDVGVPDGVRTAECLGMIKDGLACVVRGLQMVDLNLAFGAGVGTIGLGV